MSNAWSPDRFLADGTYCPSSLIRQRVERYRLEAGRPWVLLLPFSPESGTTSFGSLMFADMADDGSGLQAAVVAATDAREAHALADVLRTMAGGGGGPVPPADAEVLRQIRPLGPLRDRGLLDGPVELVRPIVWSSQSGVRFFLLGPAPTAGGSLGSGPDRVVRVSGLDDLQTMLNATRQAVLHQHERARNRSLPLREGRRGAQLVAGAGPGGPSIEDVLPLSASSHYGPAHEFEDLVEEIDALHPSVVAAIYLLDRTGTRLNRVAGRGLPTDAGLVLAAEQPSSIAFVLGDNRPPRVMNRVMTEPVLHSSIRSEWLGLQPTPADFSEVVVPIASTDDGARANVVGALVVQRPTSADDEVFDARDLVFLEQLASRISLRRANLLFDQATRALHDLIDHNMLASVGGAEPDSIDKSWNRLPVDILNARPFLERTVQLVYRFTPVAGIGLALFDTTRRNLVTAIAQGADHGLPTEPWRPLPSVGGVAALAVHALRHGAEAEVTNVRAEAGFSPFGGEVDRNGWGPVRSALALPVTVSDRTMGVILFTASRPEVLVPNRHFLRAATQQICLSVVLAQQVEEHQAFAFASSTAIHAHEILKKVDALRTHPSPEVAKLGDEIEALVDTMRTPATRQAVLTTDPFEAMAQAVAEVGLHHFVRWENERPELPPFPPMTILAVKQAAVEILKNSKLRLASDGRSRQIWMSSRVDHWGRLPRLVIEVQHCVEKPVPADLLPWLYRAPIVDAPGRGGRRHYGAFTAGYWMRAVGGDVYPWRAETDRQGRHWFGTAIDIPVLTLAPEEVAGR